MKHPDPSSKRSKRRNNRGFKSLEVSSRKHRRMNRRLDHSRTQYGERHPPGTKCTPRSGGGFVHIAGGSRRYH